MSEKKLPQKLKELRKVNNYTQDYVAAVLGIVRQTYSHYETGRRTPDAEALYKLAGLYNISIDDLMHLTVDIDREVSYDAPVPSQSSEDLSEFLEFLMIPRIKKKYMFHTNLEKELLFYFNKISEEDKKEIIEFTKIKALQAFITEKLLLQILFFMVSKEAILILWKLQFYYMHFIPASASLLYSFPQACVSPSSDVHSQCISGGNPRPRAKSPIHGCHTDVAF